MTEDTLRLFMALALVFLAGFFLGDIHGATGAELRQVRESMAKLQKRAGG